MTYKNETDIQVDNLLEEWKIPYKTRYINGPTLANSAMPNMDQWLITLSDVQFDFYTGLGHRVILHPRPKSKCQDEVLRLPQSNHLPPEQMVRIAQPWGRISHETLERAKMNQGVKRPTAAAVLYCLILDARADDVGFEYWCEELAYDPDSRKALETYLQCQDTARKLRKIFNLTQFKTLEAALEDY